jgi:hypothetical protein
LGQRLLQIAKRRFFTVPRERLRHGFRLPGNRAEEAMLAVAAPQRVNQQRAQDHALHHVAALRHVDFLTSTTRAKMHNSLPSETAMRLLQTETAHASFFRE